MNAPNASALPGDGTSSRSYWLSLLFPGTQSMGWFGKVILRLVFYVTLMLWLLTAIVQVCVLAGIASSQEAYWTTTTIGQMESWQVAFAFFTLCALAVWCLGASMATAFGGSPFTFPWSMVHHLVFIGAQVVTLYAYAALADAYGQVVQEANLLDMHPISTMFTFWWAPFVNISFMIAPLLIAWNVLCILVTWPIAFFLWLRPYLPQPRSAD